MYSTSNFADEFERIIINTGTINAGVHSSKKKKKKNPWCPSAFSLPRRYQETWLEDVLKYVIKIF